MVPLGLVPKLVGSAAALRKSTPAPLRGATSWALCGRSLRVYRRRLGADRGLISSPSHAQIDAAQVNLALVSRAADTLGLA